MKLRSLCRTGFVRSHIGEYETKEILSAAGPNGHRLKNTENDGSIAGYEELLNLETERKKAGNKNDIYERVSEVYEEKEVSNL